MTADGERWKRKYLDLIDENDQLQKRFKDQTDNLRRALVRLSLISEGRDPDLDSQLDGLRQFLRNDQITGLSKLLDRVEEGFERWQSHQERHRQKLYHALLSIETSHASLPRALKAPVKKLRKQSKDGDSVELLLGMVSALRQWAEALVEASGHGADKAGEKGDSWFGRLFGSKAEDANNQDESSDANGTGDDTTEDSGDTRQYDIEEAVNQAEEGMSQLTVEVSKLLQSLVSKLTLPNQEQPRALRLLTKIKEGLSWYELVPALEILAELVLAALGSEQQEFEAFLKTLNQRLATLQSWLKKGEELESGFKTASAEFDAKMRDHLDDLKNTLSADPQDFGALKVSVTTKLDEIFGTVNHYRSEQQTREQAFESHIGELKSRIQAMEGELNDAKAQLKKSQLKAMTDSLTQLPNRGAYDIYIQTEYERFRRYGHPLSLVVCDVDRFKSINDTYGHTAGDKVLQLISRQVKKGTRDTDLLARYGGEEFVVILPETDSEGALRVAEKIRKQVEASPFHFKGKRVQITISCGIASFTKDAVPDNVFDAADRALYAAKEGGRNQCQIGEVLLDANDDAADL